MGSHLESRHLSISNLWIYHKKKINTSIYMTAKFRIHRSKYRSKSYAHELHIYVQFGICLTNSSIPVVINFKTNIAIKLTV